MALQVEVLQETFQQVKAQIDEFAISFYENLFHDYPHIQPLFARTNMMEQRKHLIRALMLTIENIRDTETVNNALKQLGARHVEYAALQEYYPDFCATLLKTFELYLGVNWTAEVKQA
ncbi:MAG TPA: globin domain-containing protein [Phormidium sp.]